MTTDKTKKILILSAYKPAGILIDIHLKDFEHEDVYIDSTIAKCSDDLEPSESFDLTFVNETNLFERLSENRNLLMQNLGKIIVLSDYKSEINRLKAKHSNVRFIKKEDAEAFGQQITRIVTRELGLTKPMEVLV